MSQRTERVDELLRQEIGTILSREAKDPRIGFVTITEVETTPDLRHARVWVSVIGPEESLPETIRALQHTMHFVRRELGTRLRIKRIPELHVQLDDSAERGTRVLNLLDVLEHGELPELPARLDPLPTPTRRLHREGDAEEAEEAEGVPSPEGDKRMDASRAERADGAGRRPAGRFDGPRHDGPSPRGGRGGGRRDGPRPGGGDRPPSGVRRGRGGPPR